MKQATFADLVYDARKKQTKREKFLAEMQQVIPWTRWLALIEPHYPKAGMGPRPMPLERMLLHQGTIVDATIISAPPSTKNRDRKRDPDMSQTKKHNTWHFGVKAHIGVDLDSGRVHTRVTTTAKESDQNVLPQLLPGEEEEVLGDKGYGSAADRKLAQEAGIELHTMHRRKPGGELTFEQELENKVIAALRAMVEFPLRIVKQQWDHAKVRYRGLAKTTSQYYTLFALANLYQVRRQWVST